MRRVVATGTLLGLLVASVIHAVPTGAQGGPPETEDRLRAYSIVPPGQEGDVTVDELAAGDFGPHYSDQLEMYASLVDDDSVADDELEKYFHSMQFGPGADIEEEYSPTEGVTIYRDVMGIPHIYADSAENASWGLGYVTAEDRLWESDVLRHAAHGTLSEFVGPDFLPMDILTRREGYTDEEIQEILDSFDDRFGATGTAVQTGLQSFTDGFNAFLDEVRMSPDQCPAEYAATDNPCPLPFPEDWSPVDTLQLAVLQLRVFGETAGGEINNAGLYAHLTKKLGKGLGAKVFEDFMFQNDPSSPTSIARSQGKFPSQSLGSVDKDSFAIPDDAVQLAEDVAREEQVRVDLLADLGMRSPSSNALLVSAEESKTGNPLEIGAPQVGYAVPSFFMDVDVHAPGIDFRGPAVPGASALIPLGRGRDYAWSLTTGYSDAVDVRIEQLCDPAGGEPAADSTGYMFKGECKEMESRDETFIIKPSPASPGPPGMETHTFYRTSHGPVFARGAVDGKPVAFVKERFFWKKEIDSIPQFYAWNTKVKDLADFKAAAAKFTMSFNTFYADSENIAYFHVGFYPKRTPGVHPALPTWGTGEWEWKGRIPFKTHPQVINPEQGWVANWNNKPAVGWDSYDGIKWGSVQRVNLLQDGMKKVTKGPRKATLADIVNVIREAATRDTRGAYLGPKMLGWAANADGDEKYQEAVSLVADWVKGGAHRLNADRDENMDNGPALAIFDLWYENLVHKVFDDELGTEAYDLLAPMGAPITDYTPAGGSSFWFDFSAYLKNLFDPTPPVKFARNYCDVLDTDKAESCKSLVVKALNEALLKLTQDQGADMSAWAVPAENIVFSALGAGSVPEIPWQNRGTHNHVVEVLSDAE
jgi:acyl-homoserine lactone acylase PvdQ